MKQIFTERFKQSAQELERVRGGWRARNAAIAAEYCAAERTCSDCEHASERDACDKCAAKDCDKCELVDYCDDCEQYERACSACVFRDYDCIETIKMLLAIAREL